MAKFPNVQVIIKLSLNEEKNFIDDFKNIYEMY